MKNAEQALTLEAAYRGDEGDERVRTIAGHGEPLLTAAALFGANASGKSNVIEALAFMQEAVLYSHRLWEPGSGVPRDPFAWGAGAAQPSLYEITFVSGTTRYRYGFVASDDCFVEEWLFAWPGKRKQTWFTRDEDGFRYGDHLRGEHRLVAEVTRPNALFLSAAVQHRHEQLRPVYEWFAGLCVSSVSRRTSPAATRLLEPRLARLLEGSRGGAQLALFADAPLASEDYRESFLALLRAADVGIVDLKVEDEDEVGRTGRSRPRVLLRHRHRSGEGWLALEEESHGTQTLLALAPALMQALRQGSVLAVDELDASLHPLLAEHVVRHFAAVSTNPSNAQLIFTTHNTNPLGTTLGEPLLRRDQVYLTEKDADGATTVLPLSDFKPRKSENVERGYLQGRYGAIPILADLDLRSG